MTDTPKNETPKTDADIACECIDKLASQCKLNPTAYQREGKERVRTLEKQRDEARRDASQRKLKAQEYCDGINKLLLERDSLRQQLSEANTKLGNCQCCSCNQHKCQEIVQLRTQNDGLREALQKVRVQFLEQNKTREGQLTLEEINEALSQP